MQYRETQGYECKQFLNYFKKLGGIKSVQATYCSLTHDCYFITSVRCLHRYSPGGAASGFSHVEHKIKPRLMHVKGKNYPRISEVPIGWSSMNEGDAYILDIGEVFFVWNGKSCSRTERIKVRSSC